MAVAYASVLLGRPVKWIDGRRDNLMAATHGRGQKQFIEASVRKDGKILGLKVKVVCDGGAYSDWAFSMPETTIGMAPGAYDIGAYEAEAITTFTNKPPIGAYRGAGRPEATYLIERTVDVIARRLRLDPVKVRQRNFVSKKKFPYSSPGGHTYDSGNYRRALEAAADLVDYEATLQEIEYRRSQGEVVGLGVASCVEVSGGGADAGAVTLHDDGTVTAVTGTSPHGQGLATSFAQIIADELGMAVTGIEILHGDTAVGPRGGGTMGSRSLQLGGSALKQAAIEVRERVLATAADLLEVAPTDLTLVDGMIRPVGAP
ncbi:MAG: molybdopterin-dependent oxidoreductase, partial [Nitrososphaerota archaeon]|nr:molybdopterin-dependent oxidoreductase [Nitrososphaerota archaeon]